MIDITEMINDEMYDKAWELVWDKTSLKSRNSILRKNRDKVSNKVRREILSKIGSKVYYSINN